MISLGESFITCLCAISYSIELHPYNHVIKQTEYLINSYSVCP